MQIKSKFPFFRKNNFTYLDSAATTQVPDTVLKSVFDALEYRGNPNRSSHDAANRSLSILEKSKENIADFINAKPSELVFTNNTTDSINLAVDSILDDFSDGDIVIVSVAEHNSNLLPYLKTTNKGSKIKLLGLKNGLINVDELKSSLTPKTKMVAVAHCSNVLGNINLVEEIGDIVKNFNSDIYYLVDGAQAVAHVPVDVKKIKADFYTFSGHKMYGPDGVGVLYVSENIHSKIRPVRAGGGTVKEVSVIDGPEYSIITPEYDSDLSVIEGGTSNVSSIYGLSKAVNFLRSIGIEEIRRHEIGLTKKLLGGLSEIEDIEVYGPEDLNRKIGVVSFSTRGFHVKELADYLLKNKIFIRYGSHCAFRLSDTLGNETLRVSLGAYNTEEDIDILLQEIKLFFDKREGLIKNPNLERFKHMDYAKRNLLVSSKKQVIDLIKKSVESKETEVVIMGGHFLGIPDRERNVFYPSIKGLVPEGMQDLLEEYQMNNFPGFTLDIAAETVSELKSAGIKAKILIIANDTTGINELRLSPDNKEDKTAEEYREELFEQFRDDSGLPKSYVDILSKYDLDLSDIIKNKEDYFLRETVARANFKKFISGNKDFFEGMIDYKTTESDIDVDINILDNQQLKTCTFDTFNSKTGGKFCVVEVVQIIAELFGKSDNIDFEYLNEKVKEPKINSKSNLFVMLSPAICNNAINNGGELYTKLFIQDNKDKKFKFINIPFGPDASENIEKGIEVTEIANK